jgi:predicted nucleic acid-binding protein
MVSWLVSGGDVVTLPEIADYDLRRELLRRFATTSIRRLNTLHQQLVYLPLTTPVLYWAAELWAQARNRGHITASDPALDGDVILAAQALEYLSGGMGMVIATTNVKHLAFFTDARLWTDI